MLVRARITDPAAIRIRALIPDHHAALRTGRAMSMPRLERRSLPATGLLSASGTGRAGRSAACGSAASIKVGLPALLFDVFPRLIVGLADQVFDDLRSTPYHAFTVISIIRSYLVRRFFEVYFS